MSLGSQEMNEQSPFTDKMQEKIEIFLVLFQKTEAGQSRVMSKVASLWPLLTPGESQDRQLFIAQLIKSLLSHKTTDALETNWRYSQ